VEYRSNPIFRDGKITGSVASFTNITESKRAERIAQTLLEAAPDSIVVVNRNSEITLVNEQAQNTFGYTREELIGQPLELLIPERYRDKHRGAFQEYYRSPHMRSMGKGLDLFGRHKNGKDIPVEISLSPFESNEGILVAGVIRDITTRKQTEQELKKYRDQLEELVTIRTADLQASNKELESYSYSIAHDLRTPLRAITSFSQILTEDAKGRLNADDMDHLRRIASAGKRMSQLIDDILELSRITRSELRFKTVNLSAKSAEIISRLTQSQPDKAVQCEVEQNLIVKGDARLLEIALQNLIDNAWKYTRDRAPAKIKLGMFKNTHDDPVYYIKDNGAGFDMAYYDKLFKPFHRLHSPQEFEGTGIGLATVQRIIQRHGGRIWAEAEINNGATFYFTLSSNNV
jgi:PAS domain S-box-containing protein